VFGKTIISFPGRTTTCEPATGRVPSPLSSRIAFTCLARSEPSCGYACILLFFPSLPQILPLSLPFSSVKAMREASGDPCVFLSERMSPFSFSPLSFSSIHPRYLNFFPPIGDAEALRKRSRPPAGAGPLFFSPLLANLRTCALSRPFLLPRQIAKRDYLIRGQLNGFLFLTDEIRVSCLFPPRISARQGRRPELDKKLGLFLLFSSSGRLGNLFFFFRAPRNQAPQRF